MKEFLELEGIWVRLAFQSNWDTFTQKNYYKEVETEAWKFYSYGSACMTKSTYLAAFCGLYISLHKELVQLWGFLRAFNGTPPKECCIQLFSAESRGIVLTPGLS